jgi:hypothetical protein
MQVSTFPGRAIAHEVSRQLPTAAAWVRARVRSCRICGGQSGTVAGFFRVLWFALPIRIPPIHHYLLSGTSIIGQTVAALPSGLSLTS